MNAFTLILLHTYLHTSKHSFRIYIHIHNRNENFIEKFKGKLIYERTQLKSKPKTFCGNGYDLLVIAVVFVAVVTFVYYCGW